jgi:hypothetical protein
MHFVTTVTIANLRDPNPATHACAGFSVHTNSDGSTFDELAVCQDGSMAIIRILNNVEVFREPGSLPATDNYTVTAEVTSSTLTLTVENGSGATATLTASTTLTDTSYIGLVDYWRNTGMTALFANFRYNDSSS